MSKEREPYLFGHTVASSRPGRRATSRRSHSQACQPGTITARGPQGSLDLVHTFSSENSEGALLEFTPALPLTGIQFVRIVTLKSPSWVAWREIEVIGN